MSGSKPGTLGDPDEILYQLLGYDLLTVSVRSTKHFQILPLEFNEGDMGLLRIAGTKFCFYLPSFIFRHAGVWTSSAALVKPWILSG